MHKSSCAEVESPSMRIELLRSSSKRAIRSVQEGKLVGSPEAHLAFVARDEGATDT